jgi:hypothetical protein
MENLPANLKLTSHSMKKALPHVLTMHLSWTSLMIMLHKPFYRPFAQLPTSGSAPSSSTELSVKVSRRALAIEAITDLAPCPLLNAAM